MAKKANCGMLGKKRDMNENRVAAGSKKSRAMPKTKSRQGRKIIQTRTVIKSGVMLKKYTFRCRAKKKSRNG